MAVHWCTLPDALITQGQCVDTKRQSRCGSQPGTGILEEGDWQKVILQTVNHLKEGTKWSCFYRVVASTVLSTE